MIDPDGHKHDRSYLRCGLRAFIGRYLQHVPEKGRQVVRRYRLYANAQAATLNSLPAQLHQSPVKHGATITLQQYMKAQTGEDYRYGLHWGSRLVTAGLAAPREPPEKVV